MLIMPRKFYAKLALIARNDEDHAIADPDRRLAFLHAGVAVVFLRKHPGLMSERLGMGGAQGDSVGGRAQQRPVNGVALLEKSCQLSHGVPAEAAFPLQGV